MTKQPAHQTTRSVDTTDAPRRAAAILADVGQRDAAELADELAGILASPRSTWHGRVRDLLERELTPAETKAVRQLQNAPPAAPAAYNESSLPYSPKDCGTR